MPVPPPKPARPAEAALRFCLSCLATLACWCVWLVLGALLGAQIYIAVVQELPLPKAVLQRFESRLAELNLAATFARAQFDPTGRMLLENVRVRTMQFEDPVLVARSVYVEKSLLSVIAGDRAPDEIRIDGATLQLPAPLSPSGTPEPLIRDLAATIRLERSLVHIDQLAFRIGGCAVTLRGDWELPARPGAAPLDPAVVIGRVLQLGRQIVRELPELNVLEQPALAVELSVRPGIGNIAEIELTADALRRPAGQNIETGRLRATTTLRLAGGDARPLRFAFHIDGARYGEERVTAEHITGSIATEITPGALARPHAADLQFAAERIEALGQTLIAPVAHVRARGETIEAELATSVHEQVLAVRGAADLTRRTAQVHFAGSVPPSLVDAVLPVRAPRLAPYFRFGDPVQVLADATFAEGWRFDALTSRVRVGRLDSNGVEVTSARGRIDIDGEGNFRAYDAAVQAAGNHARGSYGMNFFSREFRILLTGALHPPHISGWFRNPWWRTFWAENFAFNGAPPEADVDVEGNWRDSTRTSYFGSTDATAATVRGADFERAHARVFVRPQFAHAFDLLATRSGGAEQARGWFKRFADPGTRRMTRLEFDLAGNLAPAALRELGGDTAAELLKSWEFSQAPTIAFAGHTDYDREGRGVPVLQFSGRADARVSYSGFPLERMAAEGSVNGTEVRLDKIDLRVANGRGTARALLDGPVDARRLGFDFYLEEADLVRAIGVLHDYNRANATEPIAPTNPELLKRASGGRLQFALSGEGRPGELASFHGEGNLEIAGAELGEIHLFGLLSQVLSGLSLNFSSLKLDTLRGRFKLADGRVNFPDLRVTGSTSLIEGRGAYGLVDQTLDFTARFRPYEENRNILTGVIGLVVNPLTSILELRLTGTIRKPNWSISLGQSAPKDAAPVPETSPAAPARDGGTPPAKENSGPGGGR